MAQTAQEQIEAIYSADCIQNRKKYPEKWPGVQPNGPTWEYTITKTMGDTLDFPVQTVGYVNMSAPKGAMTYTAASLTANK